MSKPYFSIIIPTLNEELFLPRLLTCLQKQTEKDFELIVVDGNSDDKTQIIAQKGKVQLYKVSKRNVAYQRNYGGEHAKGAYLLFLDADVTIYPGFLKKLKQEMTKHKGLFFIPSIRPNSKNAHTRALFNMVNQWARLSVSSPKPFVTSGSLIVERHFFNLIGGFDEDIFIGEDHNIVQKAAVWGVRAFFLNNVVLTYSLRRVKREGIVTFFSKYIFSSAHILLKGDIKKKIYEYEMGGHLYDKAIFTSKRTRTK